MTTTEGITRIDVDHVGLVPGHQVFPLRAILLGVALPVAGPGVVLVGLGHRVSVLQRAKVVVAEALLEADVDALGAAKIAVVNDGVAVEAQAVWVETGDAVASRVTIVLLGPGGNAELPVVADLLINAQFVGLRARRVHMRPTKQG